MLHGDISNRTSPILAFNVDNLLFKMSKETFMGKLKKAILPEIFSYFDREVNQDFVNEINMLWEKYPFSIYFVTFSGQKQELDDFLMENNVYYTRLVAVEDIKELEVLCTNQYTYYFDSDMGLLSLLSKDNALNYKEMWSVIRR